MPIRIIVNADDLGLSESVNDAIFRALENRVITSATVLANGAATASAILRLQGFQQCSFGVHLNLTDFRPVAAESHRDLAPILNERGCFNGNAIREIRIGPRILKAIYREWCAQIESLIHLGLQPTHLDGHHHVHTVPQVLPVLAALRRRYKINKIRISRNMYAQGTSPGPLLLTGKKLYNLALRAAGFRTTQVFTDLETFMSVCAVQPPRARLMEVMTHPGSQPPSEESRLLDMEWPGRLPYTVELVSYKTL